MARLYTNNAIATLSAGINNSVTSLVLASGKGALFPSPSGGDYFNLTLTQAGSETSWEIVKVTARSTDTLTIVRAQEGTAAAAWATSDKAELRTTADSLASKTQIVTASLGTVLTGTTILPADNTIPQNTEGIEVLTCAITPKNSASTLEIDIVINISHSAASHEISIALFQDSTANALAAVSTFNVSVGADNTLHLKHIMTSGTTSATTFKVRGGGHIAGTTTFNGQLGAQFFGGVMASTITIKEHPA